MLLNEVSATINESLFNLMNLSYNIKDKNFFNKAISNNLSLVSSKARLAIFNERLEKIKVLVNTNDKEVVLSRIKAFKFYETVR